MLLTTIRPMNEGRLQSSLFGLRTPGRPGLQLGTIHPSQSERRLSVHQSHTGDSWQPPRNQSSPMIEPFATREQTVMSYKVSNQFRFELSSGFKNPENESRKKPRSFAISRVEVAAPRTRAGDFFHRTKNVNLASTELFRFEGRN